jgi:dipeptide transport system permease protein
VRRFVLGRLALIPLVLLGLTALVFIISRLVPGDPAVLAAGRSGSHPPPELVRQIRQAWGLDRPLPVQYALYVGRLAHGDFGYSYIQQSSVIRLVGSKAAASIELTGAAMLVGVPVGLALGVRSARRQGSASDHAARLVSIAGVSVPLYWAPLILLYLFSVRLHWLPFGSRLPAYSEFHGPTGIYTLDAILKGDVGTLMVVLRYLALPALTLAIIPAAVMARFSRAIFIDVLNENYIRTAHAYGLHPRTVVWRLAAKNAILPLITLVSLLVPALIIGGVLVEQVFTWPGLGGFLLKALQDRDYVVVQSVTLLVGILYVVLNLLADVSYALLDPRTRRS